MRLLRASHRFVRQHGSNTLIFAGVAQICATAWFEYTDFCSTSEDSDTMATVSYQATLLECCVLQRFRRMQIAMAGGPKKGE